MANIVKLLKFLLRSSEELRRARLVMGVVVVAGILSGLISTGLLASINAALASTTAPAQLGWGFAALCLLLPLSRFVSQFYLVRLSEGTAFALRLQLSKRILAAPLRRLEQLGAARLLASLTDDVVTITNALTNVPLLFLHITLVVSCLGYLGWLSWRLLVIVLIAVGLGITSYQFPTVMAFKQYRAGRERWDDLVRHFRGLTEGIKELKVHAARCQDFLERLLTPTAGALRRHNVAGTTIFAIANVWGQVMFFILIGLVLFVLPGYVTIEPRVATGYTLGILYMLTPLDVILNLLPLLGRAAAAADKIEELGLALTEASAREVEEAPTDATPSWKHLQLEAVQHTYYREEDEDTFVLGPIDLTLRAGELLFLVGGNGSGKTTLAKLLIGLYSPEAGTVRLDGQAITDAERPAYRQLFSVVFADFYLFDFLLGLEGTDLDAEAKHYLRQLHLHRKVDVVDRRLSSTDLSQGQRKRLALLTAYLENRPIYLFDEWAADQDPEFKQVFYLELLPALQVRGKTIVVISHDDRYYHVADRIVKLEGGQVVLDGNMADYLQSLAAPQGERHRPPAPAALPEDRAGKGLRA